VQLFRGLGPSGSRETASGYYNPAFLGAQLDVFDQTGLFEQQFGDSRRQLDSRSTQRIR
jgi:hypothetical protein